MKKIKFLIWLSLVLLISSCDKNKSPEYQYQEDADLIRLEHLAYWTGLFEEYYKKNNTYPLQAGLAGKSQIGLVKIATTEQREYLSPGSSKYNPELDNNANGTFKEFTVKTLVKELESGLGRVVNEKYDIQKIPTSSPIGYFYFITNEGYLMWVTCQTCGVTSVSTLAMDGHTATVNIVSEGMQGQVPKAFVRGIMLSDSQYKQLTNRKFHKEKYVRELVEQGYNNSKL